MSVRFTNALLLSLVAALAAVAARAQDAAPAATTQPGTAPAATQALAQPATQFAPAENPLRSPYAAVTWFLDTAERAIAGEIGFDVPMRALDFGELADDPEQLAYVGPNYVRQLHEILSRLRAAGHLPLADERLFPRDPASGSPHSIVEPPLVFVLARIARPVEGRDAPVQEWKFLWSSVQTVPQRYEQLDRLLQQLGRPEEVGEILPQRRTPRDLVAFFLENAAKVRTTKEPEAFRAALACLDFSDVLRARAIDPTDAEAVAKFKDDEGTRYIVGLERVFEEMLASGSLALDDLPAEPDPQRKPMWALGGRERLGATVLSILLVRRGDVAAGRGQWTVAPETVRNVPDLVAALERRATVADDETPAVPVVRGETRSARATLDTFLTAMEQGRIQTAMSCLDRSELSDAEQDLAGVLAGKLWMILARREPVVLQTVPDDPAAGEHYTLLAHRLGRIEIGPVHDDEGRVQWLFTADTVRDIEPLYEEFQRRPIHADWRHKKLSFLALPELYVREYVIPRSWQRAVLGLRVWQWLGIPAALLAGWLAFLVVARILPPLARFALRQPGQMYLPGTFRRELRATALVLMLLVWWGGLRLLDLGSVVSGPVFWGLRVVGILIGTVAVFRLITVVLGYFTERAKRTAARVDDVLMPLLEKTLKFVTVALGIIFLISVLFGVQVGPLFAGLGVGGLAVAFAAKDTIANFFGSVNVVLDRPFDVGDWVKINSTEGIIEDVGIRSTKIRTFWKSQIVVPNSEIMNATIENFQRRSYRRTYAIVSVTYATTPAQLEAFCEGIRELIRRHPHTWKDYFHVFVKQFAASSIDIMVYCFHDVPDWGMELAERHRLILDIVRLAERLGVEFAFPTQTVHLVREDTDEAARGGDAPRVPGEPDAALRIGRDEAARLAGGQPQPT